MTRITSRRADQLEVAAKPARLDLFTRSLIRGVRDSDMTPLRQTQPEIYDHRRRNLFSALANCLWV